MKLAHPLSFISAVRIAPVALAALSLMATQADARIGGTPLSFSISQVFTHDSNIERTEVGTSDTISTTQVNAGLDKDYGRQNYKADIGASINRFQTLDQYNNNGVDIKLSFSTEIASSSKLTVSQARTRSLQDFDVQGTDTRRKEVTTETSTSFYAQHGIAKQWQLIGSLEVGKSAYTNTTVNARTSISRRIGARYSPSDLLFFEMGFKDANYKYPNVIFYSGRIPITTGDEIGRQDIDFQTGWTVTGYSKLFAQVNLTNEKHAVIGTGRDYQGLTGGLSWQFTPRGKVGYTLNVSRDTNDSGGFTSPTRDSVRNKLSTNLTGTALWRVTSKIKLNSGFDLQFLKEDEQQFSGTVSAQDSLSSIRRQIKVGASYDLDRSLSFACNLTQIHRTKSLFSVPYDSNATNCSATFSME